MNHFHIKVSKREKTAYIKLRRKGYSINHLAKAFGRSTSIVHAIINKAENLGIIYKISNRKLPNFKRLETARRRLATLLSFMQEWEAWVSSVEGDPP